VDVAFQKALLGVRSNELLSLLGLGGPASHGSFPLGTELLNLLLVIQLRVVVLADAAEALPERQVLGVYGGTVVLVLTALADVVPATLLFLEVQSGGVRQEDPGEQHATETEPGNNVELLLGGDVVVHDGREKSTELASSGRDTVCGGTNRRGEDLGGNQEGDRVGAELVEEGAEEVHGLEGVDVLLRGVVVVVEGGDNEEDEVHQETDDLHPLATVQLVVDEEGREVVSTQRDTNVQKVIQPAGHDRLGRRAEDRDEFILEQLVAVKEDIVGEPAASGGQETGPKVFDGELEGLDIVASHGGLLLGGGKLLAGRFHVVGTVVDQPQRAHGRNGKGDAVSPLDGHGGVRVVSAAVVEAEQQDNEDGLVEELTPALHQKGAGDLPAAVEPILPGRDLAGADSVLHAAGSGHWVFTTYTTVRQRTRGKFKNQKRVNIPTPMP